jgi:hypothetical protein
MKKHAYNELTQQIDVQNEKLLHTEYDKLCCNKTNWFVLQIAFYPLPYDLLLKK